MKTNTKKIVGTGLLIAIVFVLQFVCLAIKAAFPAMPFSITLTLAPIIIGAALYGPWSGAVLGLAFGVAVLVSHDADVFLAINPVGTIATVLVKGMLAGLIAGLVYNLVAKKSKLGGVITAGVVAPVTNTGIFLLGCKLFFMDTVSEWAAGAGIENVAVYMFTVLVGVNFLIELAENLVLATAIERIIRIISKENKK